MTAQQEPNIIQKISSVNEQAWLTLGNLAEMMTDWERAMNSYESALRHNPYSIKALSSIASLCRGREQFNKAVEYFKRILALQENNGESWSALGHCYLMMDNLQEAYHAYQQALYHLQNPKDPKLWYGIGILYDRYGSIEHAEEAFSAVMKMDANFEKANEIYFRLGIIYKQQQKYDLSLQCFRYILHNPPRPLTEVDIWFQTGHVYEQQKEYELAKEAYERVLTENPDHSKVLQQLGWLFHQQNTSFSNQATAIQILTRSLKADSNDAQSWYLLGRCYMVEQNYNKAYEAYQQAVYRDTRNPTFWCSIGVLYYQINQYRDALDAYSRAIRLNPYISEVWYDLGTLYESCNNQTQDALDAYQRASELDPSNPHIRQRLELLRQSSNPSSNTPISTPVPQDVNNPYQYQNAPTNNAYPPLPPLMSGPQESSSSPPSRRNHDQRLNLKPLENNNNTLPRDLPMPTSSSAPHQQQQQASEPPFHHPTDTNIADIRASPSPAFHQRKIPVMRSPIPSHHGKPSPRFNNNSPRQAFDEPLRRTSILYDSEKQPSQLPPVRHSSPVENSAADTLMSMSQKSYVKRMDYPTTDEEEEHEKKKSRRIDHDGNSIPVSS
ncbi:TPR-like protein [Backusella circina FSU 941]|nr:TPR-like protein [Backusella circina FSU 941]